MKYKNIYTICKELALKYGKADKKVDSSEYAVYVDPFGCDLQIYYYNRFYRGIGEMKESMCIYLGGREVFYYDEYHPDWENYVDGHWKDMVQELSYYNFCITMEETYNVNNTIVELCKMESKRNRDFLCKYRDMCSSLAKRDGGPAITDEGDFSYKMEKSVNGVLLEIYLKERAPRRRRDFEDKVDVYYGKQNVFIFHWNCSSVGGIFDDKGKYVRGEWEQVVEDLLENG